MAMTFFGAVMLPLCLDAIAAPVFWLMPFTQGRVELAQVPANYPHWIINYLRHWTFALELTIWLTAILSYTSTRKTLTAP